MKFNTKRPAEDSSEEQAGSRKRVRERDEDAQVFPHLSSPFLKPSGPASVSPSIHPDRLHQFFNAATLPDPAPPQEIKTDDSPLSPSPNPLHSNDAEMEEQRPEHLYLTSPPNLRIVTARAWDLDWSMPDQTPIMNSLSREKSHHSPSRDPRKPSYDSYRPTKSRRQSSATPLPSGNGVEAGKLSTAKVQTSILDGLDCFAQSIMSAASLTVRRDHVKQQAVGQQKERDRLSRFNSTFITLIEDAESRSEGVEKLSTEIDKQVDLSSHRTSKIISGLASQLQTVGLPDPSSSARDQGRLGRNLVDLKAEFDMAERKAAKTETDETRDRGLLKEDLSDLKADLEAATRNIDYLTHRTMTDELQEKLRSLVAKDELQTIITRDDLQGMITKDELRRVTSDEVQKRVTETLIPTEKKLASLIAENAKVDQRLGSVEAVIHNYHESVAEKEQHARSHLETSLQELRMELSRLELKIQKQNQDYATVKVDLEAQDKAVTSLEAFVRSNEHPSPDQLIMKQSEQLQPLEQRLERLDGKIAQIQDIQANSNIKSFAQVSAASVEADSRMQNDLNLIQSKLEDLTSEHQNFRLVRHDVDALKLDVDNVVLIRNDLDSLISEEKLKDTGVAEGFERIEESLNKQHEDIARLKTDVRLVVQSQNSPPISNHPPTPPFASASTSPRESDHQTLQDVETKLRQLTKTTQSLELFVNSQQQKFDGLTSDRVVQSMVHQMQQMYPNHPGHLVGLVNQTAAKQAMVDNYLRGNLNDRLANIESQAFAQVNMDSRIEKITQDMLSANTSSLKKDMEGLRLVALNDRQRDSSDYSARLNVLADRVTTIEMRYVKAINDLQTNQTDLVRDVSRLQYRTGTASTRDTPAGLSRMSTDSKSVEPNGIAFSHQNGNDSDCSDTPLSQRSGRGVREDKEEGHPIDPDLKRKGCYSDDEKVDEGGEARSTSAKKTMKRRNISGKNPFS